MNITDIIGKGFDLLTGIGTGILNLLSKGKLDETEIAKARLETERFMANLENLQAQLMLAVQQSLIDLEKATAARWRTPLILVSGGALVAVCLNNVLAACYLPAARPVSLASPEIIVLAGMFVLLVTGNAVLLVEGLRKRMSDKDGKSETQKGEVS